MPSLERYPNPHWHLVPFAKDWGGFSMCGFSIDPEALPDMILFAPLNVIKRSAGLND